MQARIGVQIKSEEEKKVSVIDLSSSESNVMMLASTILDVENEYTT